jgi:hypothetical protein
MNLLVDKRNRNSVTFRLGASSFAAGALRASAARVTPVLDPASVICRPLHHSNCQLISPFPPAHPRFLTTNSNRHMPELEMPVTYTKQRLRHFLIDNFGAFFYFALRLLNSNFHPARP